MKWMKYGAALMVAGALLFVTVGCAPEKISGAAYYDKAHYVNTYKGDLDSDLSVFPDTVDKAQTVNVFASSMATGLFDTDGYIVLDCVYGRENYEAEVARLSGLSKTITHHDGKTFTNKVLYDTESFWYPAIVANDGFGSTNEYALLDDAGNRIVYVYTAYINPAKFPYPDYLRKDWTQYDRNATECFSLYNHTFDGGQSWDEFDDLVSDSDSN